MVVEKRPFISICIASYNYERYLIRSFEAIKKQRFNDFEIIYLDDASDDNSVEVIENIIRSNPEMSIRLKKRTVNEGLLKTKSELLEMAVGKYIMLCDADDWMADECLLTLYERAKKSNADRVISQVYDIDSQGKILQIQDFAKEPSKWLWNIHHGCLYKRDIIEKNNIKILCYPDDVYLTTLFNCYAQKIEWISKPLYYWFVHDDSAGRSITKKNQKDILENFSNLIHLLMQLSKNKVLGSRNEIELLMIKIYYLQIFHEINGYSIREKIKLYNKIKMIMNQEYSDYFNNIFLKKRKTYPARNYAMKIMKMGVLLEKFHLIVPAIYSYHFLIKWMIFDQ